MLIKSSAIDRFLRDNPQLKERRFGLPLVGNRLDMEKFNPTVEKIADAINFYGYEVRDSEITTKKDTDLGTGNPLKFRPFPYNNILGVFYFDYLENNNIIKLTMEDYMIDIKNGIAYSGDINECGNITDKINHAITNKINYVQIRAKDIQDLIMVNDKIDNERVKELVDLISSYSGTLSVHLPNPVWDYDNFNLSSKNELVKIIIKDLLLPLGIVDYTIHPHFNRKVYESINQEQKETVLVRLSEYFAELTNLGINLAIENIPVRDINTINEIKDREKKEKAEKNLSYGMTIEEIQNILNLTKNKVNNGRVGITYDTGHSLSMINDNEEKSKEIEKWIEHFKDDILIYHISPNLGNDPDKLSENAIYNNQQLLEWVYECSQKYNIDALTFVEAHANLNKLTELFNISEETKYNISQNNYKSRR